MTAATAFARRPAGRSSSARMLAGWSAMTMLILRRNWLRMAIWVAVLVIMIPIVYASQRQTFPTQADRDAYAQVANTPAVAAMTGLPYAAGSLGGILVIKIWMTLAVALCFAVLFAVTRNGRADEEAGRTELLRSTVLGRHAYTVANLAVTAGLCVVAGLGIAVACLAVGLPVAGSWVMGASIAGAGLAFVGVAAICGQLTTTSRGANGLAVVVLAVFYFVRAGADLRSSTDSSTAPDALSWLSPIGWAQNLRAFGTDRWWPLALLIGLGVLTGLLAVAIEARRDLGAGVLPQRPGPRAASTLLRRPWGLVARLQRGSMTGWALGAVVAGLFFGGVATAMASMIDPAGAAAKMFVGSTKDVLDGVLAIFILFGALLAAAYAVQSVAGARLEEAAGRAELQLAGAVSRLRWLGAHVVVGVSWSTVILVLGGFATALAYGSGTLRLTGAALVYWPAVVVMIGVVLFCLGWLPRLTIPVAWTVYGLSTVAAMFGGLLSLPAAVIDATPFAAVPRLPAETLSAPPLLALVGIAVVLGIVGSWGFCRRDLVTE